MSLTISTYVITIETKYVVYPLMKIVCVKFTISENVVFIFFFFFSVFVLFFWYTDSWGWDIWTLNVSTENTKAYQLVKLWNLLQWECIYIFSIFVFLISIACPICYCIFNIAPLLNISLSLEVTNLMAKLIWMQIKLTLKSWSHKEFFENLGFVSVCVFFALSLTIIECILSTFHASWTLATRTSLSLSLNSWPSFMFFF